MIRALFFCAMGCAIGAWSNAILAQTDSAAPATANSTRKIRVQPGPLAAQIGNGIAWESSLSEGLAKAAASKKPVMWYVHTVPETFMDRKVEIDRYMLAAPFSWEETRQFIQHHFVPVKAAPTAAEQATYQLFRYEFVEPGILILDGEGAVVRRLDRLTTLHPQWWMSALEPYRRDDYQPPSRPAELVLAWARFCHGDPLETWPQPDDDWSSTHRLELDWLRGMVLFRDGQQAQAAALWTSASERHRDHPLAWKLAAEAEGFGPFVRGFEVHDVLPEHVLADARGRATSSGAPLAYDDAALWQRGVEFLLGMQRADGGWFDSDYDFGGTDSLPNVHAAVTALCGMALLDAESRGVENPQRVRHSIERAARYLANEQHLNRSDRDELTWALAYRVQFLARHAKRNADAIETLQRSVRDLEQFQSADGGWFHEYRNAFVSGTALTALADARDAGVAVDPEWLRRGLESLRRERFANGAFPYSSRRSGGGPGTDRDLQGSAGRMPICELALWRWDAADDATLAAAVHHSFEHHELLQQALKYDDHTDRLAYGGFFFWYGVWGRSLAIEHIADADVKRAFQQRQRDLIRALPELDGCFVDSHELGRCYGTALALMALNLCE